MSDWLQGPFHAQLGTLLLRIAIVLLMVALAVVPAWRRRSWRALGRGLLVTAFGVFLPLIVFLLSGAFAPEAKSSAHHGWVDSLHEGKFALTPLVLWATAALYAYEMSDPERRNRPWALVGIVVGAVVSLACLVHGAATIPLRVGRWGFLLPLYVVLWYALRAVRIVREGAVRAAVYVYALLCTVPFWIYSVVLARQSFRALPDTPLECFIVSAAARGHAGFVGSWEVTDRRGRRLAMNRQLAVFWRLEDLGRRRAPRLHAAFRRVYDVWGYRASTLISTPLVADAVYCALKPCELAAVAVLALVDSAAD